MEDTIAFAKRLADKPPFSMASIKYLANKLHEVNMSIFFELEANLMGMALQTKDHQEGLAAFIEKRKPLFTGE